MADLSNSLSLCVAEEQLSKRRCQLVGGRPTQQVKYAVDAGNYRMDAAGLSLFTGIYYLSQVLATCNMRATFDIL